MTFYNDNENDLNENYIILNQNTSDIFQRDNANSNFLLSSLNEFMSVSKISPEVINIFNHDINQRVAWENIILFDKFDERKTFNFSSFKDEYDLNIPKDYLLTFDADSIIDAGLEYFNKYLKTKYINFDFNVMKSMLERKNHFTSFNYIFKVFNMFEVLLPMSIKDSYDELIKMFNGIPLVERVSKMKDQSYIGMVWNMSSAYLSKCDPDIHEIFMVQHWDFISEYVVKNYIWFNTIRRF